MEAAHERALRLQFAHYCSVVRMAARALARQGAGSEGTHYNFSFSKTIIYITYLLSILLSDAETREIPDRWRVYDSLTSYMDMQL